MTTEQFTYWLQGFMEMADPSSLSETQTQQIKDHLNLVFDKQTPTRTFPTTDPFPRWQEPHQYPAWSPDIFKPVCGTPDHITTPGVTLIDLSVDDNTKRFCNEIEESHNKLFCETTHVPLHMIGKGKQNNIIKQAMEIASKDVQIPKVIREGKVQMNKNTAGKGGIKC